VHASQWPVGGRFFEPRFNQSKRTRFPFATSSYQHNQQFGALPGSSIVPESKPNNVPNLAPSAVDIPGVHGEQRVGGVRPGGLHVGVRQRKAQAGR
jgi:hypothetical protein